MADPVQVPPELLESMAAILSQALRASLPAAAADAGSNLANAANAANNGHLRAPRFNMAEYRPTEGTTVKDYFTRFSWALELSEIPVKQHANYARVYMGRDLNDALKFLISPRLPEALEYAEIQQALIKHFDHAKNKFAESIKFRKLTQNSGESVADFALRLKQGAVYCEFDAFLDRMLIEQLLFGLESQVTCDEIIAKKPASFAEAFEVANALEATRLTSDTVKNKVEPTNKLGFAPPKLKYTKRPNQGRPYAQPQGVHKPTGLSYQPRQSQDKQWACQGCGGQHARSQCPYRDAICNACNKRGHIAPVCRSGNVRQVKEHSDSEEELPAEQVDQILRLNKMDAVNAVKFPGKVVLDVLINGRNVKMEIDTGAPCAIVSKQTLDSAKIKYKLLETNQQFASFSGHRISCLGRTSVNAQIGSSVRRLDLYVADGLVDSLLGREWIVAFANEINLSILFGSAASVHAVNPVSPRPSLQRRAQLDSILTQFKDSKANANADYCSRAPLPTTVNQVCLQSLVEGEGAGTDEFDQFIIHQIKQLPVRAEAIARATNKDEHLGNIRKLLESGQDLLRHGFKPPEANYTLAANCLLFEHRVVIPPSLRSAILQDLHAAHIGIVKMKGLARSFVFWPGIDAAIEHVAKSCAECAKHAHAPVQFREHHWEYPTAPWQRIHIDYAGPVAGNMLLIIVDSYSKWLEVRVTKSTTSAATSRILDDLFAAFGAPVTLVSDNAPQFTSAEFKDFLIMSGVKYHKLTAPYHPSTNGQAERYVQTVKDALRAMSTTESTLQTNINEFLRQYRKAPHATTGASPAQLFIGRDLRTRLNLALPDDLHTKISEKQKASFDASYRTFHRGDLVYFLSENPRMDKWVVGEIVSCLGELHYEIEFHGKRFKRHIDQIRSHEHSLDQKNTTGAAESDRVVDDKTNCGALRRARFYGQTQAQPEQPQTPRRAPEPHRVATPALAPSPPATPVASPVPAVLAPAIPSTPRIPRRSQRERRAPLRFSPQ